MALKKIDLVKFEKTKKIVKTLPEDKRERASLLIHQLEFIIDELEGLKKIIAEKGWVEEYQNGENQRGFKKCSEGEVYNTLLKSHNATFKMLNDMLPDTAGGGDELEEWLNK